MRKRNKSEKFTREDKLLARSKNYVLEPGDGILPATIVEEHKEPKPEHKERNNARAFGLTIRPKKNRGVGFTKKDKTLSKKKSRIEKNSRKINAKIAKKVHRPTGSKQRK